MIRTTVFLCLALGCGEAPVPEAAAPAPRVADPPWSGPLAPAPREADVVVATVDGTPIYASEVAAQEKAAWARLIRKVYEPIRSNAPDAKARCA